MFSELTNFALIRESKEAFGFYCAYFLLIMLGAVVISNAIESFVPGISREFAQRAGATMALVACVFLAYRVLKSKRLMNNSFSYIFLIVTVVLTFFGGVPLGMIVVAYLTTKSPADLITTPPTPTATITQKQSEEGAKT